jgi:hypothetical protein
MCWQHCRAVLQTWQQQAKLYWPVSEWDLSLLVTWCSITHGAARICSSSIIIIVQQLGGAVPHAAVSARHVCVNSDDGVRTLCGAVCRRV